MSKKINIISIVLIILIIAGLWIGGIIPKFITKSVNINIDGKEYSFLTYLLLRLINQHSTISC